jgi:hypothetical protein
MPRKSKYAISDEKKELLLNLIEAYNVKTTAGLQGALKDLLGGTIHTMLEQGRSKRRSTSEKQRIRRTTTRATVTSPRGCAAHWGSSGIAAGDLHEMWMKCIQTLWRGEPAETRVPQRHVAHHRTETAVHGFRPRLARQ